MQKKVLAYARTLFDGFDPRYLGIAAITVVSENFRRVSFAASVSLARLVDPTVLVSFFPLGAVIAACLLMGIDAKGRRPPRLLVPALSALMALGLIPLEAAAGDSLVAGYAGFALGGFLMVLLSVGWVSVLAAARPRLLPLYCASGFVLGKSLRGWFCQPVAEDPAVATAGIVLCCVASAGLIAWLSLDVRRQVGEEQAAREVEPVAPRQAVRFSLNVAAVGYAISWVTRGILSVPPYALAIDHNFWTPVVESLVCGVLLVALFAPGGAALKYDAAHDKARFAAPFLAICMIYFCFIRMLGAGGTLKLVLSLIGDAGMVAFSMLCLYLAALNCAEKRIPAASQVAPAACLCAAAHLLGTLLYACLGDLAMYVQIFVITVYLLALTADFVRKASTGEVVRRARRVEELAQRWGLSARETEVVALMSADYSNAAIAESLVISPETVRTHQKRIYAKAGVHKREDLLREMRGV